ncbi:A/G-specific adenine glycosylase [Spongisporangium articulatum]|uniref:Adenine DNA glycosylase n=1 Tax=Spongisporangium articulatum TaxID=3362603 RepID=A0ABW8ANJ8_9ACTN
MRQQTTGEHPLVEPVIAWYDANARDLPWRAPGVPAWPVLISEVMLQQTPVNRVLPVWREWVERWPTPAALAAETPGEVIRAWGRLGYPRRALRLHEAAGVIVERHGGELPTDHAQLLALPGIGTYTAAAVATFAYGQRHAVVDVNVRRVHARAVTGDAHPQNNLSAAESALAQRLLPEHPRTAARWAIGVMELGALVCTARTPRCGDCPVEHLCAWRAAGSPAHDGPPRRGQAWAGTDRQVRGKLMAALRATRTPLTAAQLREAAPDDVLKDPRQRERCLAGLVEDGLVEPLPDDRYRLPH